MDLVKKFDEINLFSEIGDNKNKNKELLLVSLLEYVLTSNKDQSNDLYKNICDYIYKNKIIDNLELLTDKYEKIRQTYIIEIKNLVSMHVNNNDNDNKDIVSTIYDSRYKNDFVEIEKIGIGGFGIVYKSKHKLDNMMYAIKKIPINDIASSNYSKILNEVNCLATLNNNKIIRYYSSWIEFMDNNSKDIIEIKENSFSSSISEENNDVKIITYENPLIPVLYIQMELCCMTLKDYIFDNDLTYYSIKKIFYEIILGIQYLHSKDIIHCDLNLKNILINENNNIKISDFGMAKFLENNDSLNISDEKGTLIYMAPEIKLTNTYSFKSDIYSLGIIYFELLNRFKTEMERVKSIENLKISLIDNDICALYTLNIDLILKMINKNPLERPTVDEIIQSFTNSQF